MAKDETILEEEQGVIMDASEAMSIIQLPIIEERFALLKQQIQTEINQALALECTEETVKSVKKARAALNAQFQKNYEIARKEIKTKVLAPYNMFEELYKENVATQFQEADKKLADKIAQVEDELKDRKKEEALAYFNEYKASLGLSDEPLTWEDMNIGITLSMSSKKLREAVKQYLDNFQTDLVCIKTREDADEVMVEYRKTHSLNQAIYAVEMRHEAIQKERERLEALKQEQEMFDEHESEIQEVLDELKEEQKQEVFSIPTVEKEEEKKDEEQYSVTFQVTGTLDEIVRLRNYLDDNALDWEQVEVV